MDRREVSRVFRARLGDAMERAGASRAGLARRVGIDRSTLAQLLSADADRLPRADTVAAIAADLKVSLDWLLGLSQVDKLGADILHESLQVAPSAQEPVDEQIIEWFEEAAGTKVRSGARHPPGLRQGASEVLRHEYRAFSARSLDRAIGEARDKLARLRLSDTDMEICMPLQGMEDFADGSGIWRALPAPARARQFERLLEVVEELYPRLRVYLFDALTHYSAPYTIFGRRRVALYAGQVFLVFNTAEHLAALNRHFDDLIRAAVVTSAEIGAFLRGLEPRVRDRSG